MLDPSPFQTMALNFCKTFVQALVIIHIFIYDKDERRRLVYILRYTVLVVTKTKKNGARITNA